MDRHDFVVEYRGVFMRAGERLHLPKVRGILIFLPAPDCDARLLCGTQAVTVKRDRTLLLASNALAVTEGTLSCDLIFCGNAR